MKYFSHFRVLCQPKNKAQEKALAFGKAYSETLLNNDLALDKFVQKLQLGIDMINHANKRCSDMDYTKNPRRHQNEFYFTCADIFSYNFYPVLQELNVNEPTGAPAEDKPEIIFKF